MRRSVVGRQSVKAISRKAEGGRLSIFHFPIAICHLRSRVARQSMTNDNWKMENLPPSAFRVPFKIDCVGIRPQPTSRI